MKGFIVFFINYFPDLGQDIEQSIQIMRVINTEVIKKFNEYGYEVMFIGTTKEGTRVEKVDFDLPFPRYVLPRIDIVDNDEMMKFMKEKAVQEEDDE